LAWVTPSWRAVNTKRAADPTGTTLGDVLYADGAGGPAEADWVRLVEAIATGDQAALRAVYARTHRIVFTLAYRICGNRELAEEVTLDVFHDVWRKAAQYEPDGGSVVSWIMIQARSRAIDRLRFEQRKKRVDPLPDAPEHGDGGAATIAARQRRHTLDGALSTLTPHERAAIETAFFSGLTYAETADVLDEPVGTVKTRVRSALIKLRKALGAEGGDV
jgi:RNA polymerase sigma-70 factor (ECF subfamily)